MYDKPLMQFSSAYDLAQNKEPALVVLLVLKTEIEECSISSMLEKLSVLVASLHNIHLYQGSIAISVDGYDEDPRELCEIPEVRRFFRELNSFWPHWIWFMSSELGTVSLVLAILFKARVIRNLSNPTQIFTDFDKVDLMKRVGDLGELSTPLLIGMGVTLNKITRVYGLALQSI